MADSEVPTLEVGFEGFSCRLIERAGAPFRSTGATEAAPEMDQAAATLSARMDSGL